MPDQKITDLGDGGLPQPTDDFVVARAGTNNKIAWSSMSAAATAGNVAIAGSNTTYTSGTVVLTGAGGGVTVGSNAGQQVVVSVAAPVAQSVQTQNVVDLTLDGNTAGALQLVSSGTLTLAGGNNITLSQAGNAITISGPNAGGAQTGISALANSETTYTSGSVTLSEAGAITIASGAGQQFQFSVPDVSSLSATGVVSISANGSTISIGAPAQTVQTQDVVDLTLDGNTAGALALISSGTATFAGGNNITLSQAGNAITISGPNVGGAQTGISGIVGSDATYTSGTVTFSGVGGGVTINSNTGQRIDISVAAQSVQPETQTFIAGISASDTLYTSGNVRISGSNAITVKSGTGQLVVIDAPVQTNQSGNVYASSNTFGTSSGTYDARTISIAGRGAVSVAASNSGWIISAPVQSTQVETQTFIGGISASDTLYTSGSVRFTGSNAVTVKSGTGQLVVIDVPTQTTQVETQTFIGGISASDTVYTSGTVKFSGVGGGITVSSNTGQRVDLSVAAPVAQTNQSGNVYASSNTFGTSSGTYDARSLSIAGSGNVSVAASNSGWVISVPASAAQTNQAGSVYAISNTSGTSSGTYDARTLSIAGAGIVTVAASNSGWRINASQSVQAGSVYASSNTFGTSSGTYDARTLSIAGSGAVSVAASNSGWVISAPVAVAQTNQSGNVYASSNTFGTSSGTYDARSISIAGSGAVSVAASNSGWVVSAPAQTAQTQGILAVGASTGGNTLGDTGVASGTRLVFVGSNNITVSQGTAANATTLTISGPTTAAQTNQAGSVYAISNTSGTSSGTYDARTLSIAGAGLVTVAASNSGWRVDASNQNLSIGVSTGGNTAGNTTVNTGSRFVIVGSNGITASAGTAAGATTITLSGVTTAAQTNQSGNIYASSNTFGTSSGTYDARSISIAGSGAVSVAASNSGWVISAPAQSVQTQGILNVALSTGGNTLGDTGLNSGTRMVLAGGANITLSGSSAANASTITIIGPSPGAASYSVGVSTAGNTAGSTGVTGTRIVFVGTNMVSLSQATDATGGTISINATQSVQTQGVGSIGVSTGGATSGDTTVNTGTRFVLVGTNITMSQGTAAGATTVTVSAPATSSLSGSGGIQISTNGSTISIGYAKNLYDWQNFPVGQGSLISHVSGFSKTPIYWNNQIPGNLTAKSLAIKVSMVTASQPLSVSVHLGVYTFVNSTSANLLGSVSEAYVVSSASSVSFSGIRNLVMTGIGTHATLSTLSDGEYMWGLMFSATATNAMNFSLMGASGGGGPLGGIYPGTNQNSTATNQAVQVMWGRGSTTVNAMPNAVSSADLVNLGAGASQHLQPWIYIRS